REGKILGKNSLNVSLENKIYEDINEMVVTTYYSKNIPPKEIIFDEEVAEKNIILRHWFKEVFIREVDLTFPKIKSRKKELLEMAKLNLEEEIKNYYRKKSVLEKGLVNIYKSLSLKNYPRRIECFDISNISGKDAVASMSVSIDGITKPKEYRKFKISSKDTPDDFAMMKEVIERRYSKLTKEEFPDMILIDGGLGQINAVGETLKELGKIGISDLLSLAKKEEEVYKFGISQPYIFSKSEESIKILQRVRDEAHRFGVTYHRKLRSKRVLTSELDEIVGVGKNRKQELLKKFKKLENVFSAPLEELKKIVPESVALNIMNKVKKHT
ncbi:MAG: excinuclease ABC subunit UvrC, partial [Fusobacteriaceae bacterium]